MSEITEVMTVKLADSADPEFSRRKATDVRFSGDGGVIAVEDRAEARRSWRGGARRCSDPR